MADILEEGLQHNNKPLKPLTYTDSDCVGPFHIKLPKATKIHLHMLDHTRSAFGNSNDLSTDSFILHITQAIYSTKGTSQTINES